MYPCSESVTENPVAIAEQIARDSIKWKCLAQLLCRPFGRRVRGDIEVEHPTPVMRQYQKQRVAPGSGSSAR
jgi:hypothetical protein